MKRRRNRRIVVLLDAEIISSAKSYSGFLETPTEFNGVNFYTYVGNIVNISEDGMMITVPERVKFNFIIGSKIEVGFLIHSEKRLNLHCEIKWFETKTTRDEEQHCIGMKIINPPLIFSNFLKARLDQI